MKILLTFGNLQDAPHPQHPWTARHCSVYIFLSYNVKSFQFFQTKLNLCIKFDHIYYKFSVSGHNYLLRNKASESM